MTDPPVPGPRPDGIPDGVAELLSGLIDGAVTDAERTEAEAWIARSPVARAEYEDLGRVKAVLRDLPAVEPPFGLYERLLRRPGGPAAGRSWWRSPGALVASGIATAAAWAVLGGAGSVDQLVPPIDDVQVAAASSGGLRQVAPADAPVDEPVEVAADGESVTVLRQEGSVDWDELPAGFRTEVDGSEVWVAAAAPATVIVQREGAVFTLVSERIAVAGLVAMVDQLPEGDADGFVSRARDACRTLVETFTWSA